MNPKNAKYTTLAELAAAFKSGELDDTYYLWMDKGGNALTLHQHGPEEGENERWEKCQKIFKWSYSEPLTELFEMAGIPAEWC